LEIEMNDQAITLSFTLEQVNVILRHLDAGAHAQVRQLIDLIITETNAQTQLRAAPTHATEESAGGTD
jgi:hypothetical protein